MNAPRRISASLILTLTIAAIVVTWTINSSVRITRFSPRGWLTTYGAEATAYSRSLLTGNTNYPPTNLKAFHIEHLPELVSFTCRGGALNSSGMAYSEEGKAPARGLGGEPRVIRWEAVESNWYYWVAD
jgi:hypothetical protein